MNSAAKYSTEFQRDQHITTICCQISHIEKNHKTESDHKSYFTTDFEKALGKTLMSELLDILTTSNNVYIKSVPHNELLFFKEYDFIIGKSFNKTTGRIDDYNVMKLVLRSTKDKYIIVTAYPYRGLPLHDAYWNPLKKDDLRACPNSSQQCKLSAASMKCPCFQ